MEDVNLDERSDGTAFVLVTGSSAPTETPGILNVVDVRDPQHLRLYSSMPVPGQHTWTCARRRTARSPLAQGFPGRLR